MKANDVILIGYSGHALVVAEALSLSLYNIVGYLEKRKSDSNLLGIEYLGFEQDEDVLKTIKGILVFPAIGDNFLREKVIGFLNKKGFEFVTAIHPKSNVSSYCKIGLGSLVCQGAIINPFATVGNGVIINTGSIIEHECVINDFAHIAPGAVLAGNVNVGKGSFIGANSVIKQGVIIGDHVTIGAGSVVLKNIENNTTFAGNPAKLIIK
ncbi:MAG: acetyltransferase [Bacteroidales bacterium]|nr:acetyltransferase [Bacteroidales bacterium]